MAEDTTLLDAMSLPGKKTGLQEEEHEDDLPWQRTDTEIFGFNGASAPFKNRYIFAFISMVLLFAGADPSENDIFATYFACWV